MHIRMAAREEECSFAVKRAAGVSEHDFQFRKVDGNIIDRHRIGEDISRPRKHRRAGVKHHRNAAGLAFAIDIAELRIVWRELLMRRMNFDHSDTEIEDAYRFGTRVARMSRMHRAD